jgi:predicted nucleic acid-binding protein
MVNNKIVYYWDTSIFIAWLRNEDRPNREMDGVYSIAEKIQKNQAILITSQMLTVELLPSTLTSEAVTLIERFFKRKNAQKKPMDGRIPQIAQGLRSRYKLSSPDSIHLATAVYYVVDEFHTFDDKLLSLNGDVDGYPLLIRKPPITQYRLEGI